MRTMPDSLRWVALVVSVTTMQPQPMMADRAAATAEPAEIRLVADEREESVAAPERLRYRGSSTHVLADPL